MLDVKIYANERDPALPELRRLVEEQMEALGLLPCWKEYYDANTREGPLARHWPAITLADKRVTNSRESGLPEAAVLRKSMERILHPGRRRKGLNAFRKTLSFLFTLFIAFFPKCPFCWASYLSALGFIGTQPIPYKSWYLPLSIGLLVLNLVTLHLSMKSSRLSLALVLTGAATVALNRLYVDSMILFTAGCILLLFGSAWSSLPAPYKEAVLNWRLLAGRQR